MLNISTFYERILMKFLGLVERGQGSSCSNFGGNPDSLPYVASVFYSYAFLWDSSSFLLYSPGVSTRLGAGNVLYCLLSSIVSKQ